MDELARMKQEIEKKQELSHTFTSVLQEILSRAVKQKTKISKSKLAK